MHMIYRNGGLSHATTLVYNGPMKISVGHAATLGNTISVASSHLDGPTKVGLPIMYLDVHQSDLGHVSKG